MTLSQFKTIQLHDILIISNSPVIEENGEIVKALEIHRDTIRIKYGFGGVLHYDRLYKPKTIICPEYLK